MVLFWKIILQVLAVCIVIVVSVLDYVKIDRRTRRFKRFRYLLFSLILLFLTLNLAVVIFDEQSKQQEVSELKQQISVLNQQNDFAKNLLTGGNSFAYIELFPQEDNSFNFILMHKGDYPLYDVNVVVVDKEKFDDFLRTDSSQDYIKNKDTFAIVGYSSIATKDVGNLFVNGASKIANIKLYAIPESQKFEVFIAARNGSVTASVRFRRIKEKWTTAVKAIRVNTNETVYENISPDFPRNSNGEVDWN
jgi:hypothetical protein